MNKFAETNADIIDGMERSGAAFAAMGEDMRNAFALFTGAQEIVQASDVVGTALKTLSLRLRGYDEETEQLSDDVVIATGKVADLTKTASNNYNGISLWKDADQTQYKSIKDYLGEIAAIWDEIDAKDQTQIIERLFGKRGAAAGSAILGNFDQVEKALVEMENSAGAADAEMDIIRDSIDFKINNLKEVWTGTFQDILKRDDLGKIIDTLAKFSEAIGGVIDKIGLLGTAGVGIGAFLGVKHFEDIRKGLKDFVDNAKTYVTAFNSVSNIGSTDLTNPEILKQYTDAIKGLNSEEANLILTRTGLNEQTKLQILSNAELLTGNQAITAQVAKEIVAQNILSQEDVNLLVNEKLLNLERIDEAVQRGIINAETADAIKLKLQEISVVKALTSWEALLNAEFLKSIGSGILNFIKSPIGVLLALTAAVAGVVAIVDKLNVSVEEQIEIAKEAHKKAQESKSDYEDISSQLETIKSRIEEINNLPSISLIEEDELEELSQQAAVLERIAFLKEQQAKDDAKNALKEDVNTYNKRRQEEVVGTTEPNKQTGFLDYLVNLDPSRKEKLTYVSAFEYYLDAYTKFANETDKLSEKQYNTAKTWLEDELVTLLNLKKEMQDVGEYDQKDYNKVYEDIRRIYKATGQFGEYNTLVISDLLNLAGIKTDDLTDLFLNKDYDEAIKNNLILSEGLEHLNFLLRDGETSAEVFKKYIDNTLGKLANSGKVLKGYVTNFDAVLAQIVRFEDDGSTSSALEYFENQMSTISGYIEKIKSGTFNSSDLLAVQKLGVKGTLDDLQSIQDQLEKMMSGELKEVYEQITQIIEGNKLSNDVEKKLKDLQKSLVGIYDEAKKISKIDTFSQQLDNLYKLNEGLSQLSEVYKDVIDPESTDVFDYSKILGNDSFKKAFQGLPGSDQYKAYEEFIKTVTTSPADIRKSQEAFNNLVTEYVYASGALDGLNEENAEATELYLKQNGIINAHEVIVAELAKRQAELAANTLLSNDAKLQEAVLDLKAAGAGWNKITELINEANATNEVKYALYNLIAQQTVFNNQNLNTTQKITALNNLAEAYAGLIDMERYEIMMNALRSQGLSGDQLATEQERILKQLYDEATKYSFKEFLDFKPEDLDKKGNDFKETIDWIETKLARIDRIIENLNSKADDTTVSWGTRIKALNKEIGETTSELDVLTKARDRYLQEANSVVLSASYKRKVRNGTIDIEKITNEALKDSIEEYRENYEKYLGVVDKITEKERELRNLEVKRFDNEVAQHEERVADLEYENSLLENQIAIYGAKGYNQTIDQYKKQNEQVKERINLDKAELEVLKKLRKESGLSKTSEAYKEMTSRIRELNTTIAENTLKIQENNKAIGESLNEASNFIQSRYDFAKAEQDFLRSLIKEENYFNKVPTQKWSKENAFDYATAGMLTNEGRMAMGSYFSEIELNKKAMEKENADWKKLLAERYEGKEAWHNPEFIAYYEEHKQRMQELVSQNQEYKDSIIDMVKNGINVELDSIKSLIDQYDKALDSQKDLYDYQKNVEKQTKDITKLRKQLAAYEGDTSEENKARVQRLKVDLADAEEGLRDTEYERELSQQKSMLDDLYSKYSNMLTEFVSQETETILNRLRTSMDSNYDQISTDIQTLAEKNGYNMSIFADRLWNNPESIVYGKVSNISTGVDAIVDYLSKVDNKNTGKISSSISNSNSNAQIPGVNGINPNAAPIGLTAKTIRKVPVYSSSNGGEPMFYTEKGATVTILPESNLALSGKDGKKPYYVRIVSKDGKKQYGWIAAKTNLEGYRSGVHNLTSNRIAWTQESGSEAIIRPSDGAILTPLKSGDSVLTSTQTENLFGFAKNPLEFLKTVSGIDVGNVGTKQLNNVINNDMNFSIELPNVSNYEEFVYQMQHDKKFEVMIRSMTTDRLFGKSAMNKYKI